MHESTDGAAPVAERPHDGLMADYLALADEPLILVNGRGRVALRNEAAARWLGPSARAARVGRSSRALLRLARTGNAGHWRDLVKLLRARHPGVLRLRLAGRTLEVDVRPLQDGWAVRSASAVGAGANEEARVDPLTRLPNRARLQDWLAEATARLDVSGAGFAVLMVDLDRFKQVNDSLGHAVGDALLRTVADRLLSALRPNDIVARVGGDEFVVLQPGVTEAGEAETLAARLVDLVGRAYLVDGHLLSIGASVGVTLAPTHGVEADVLLKNADLALYRAKRDGRGIFRFFEPSMNAVAQARRLLEIELRKALALREFELHYQAQLNLESNRLVGFEALLRWRHPKRGTISPGDFVPLAEEIGLIVPIGEWVMRTACKEAARWPDDISVAVNLSPAQFRSKHLVDMVVGALVASKLPARRLELEITEGVLLQDNDATLATLHRLRDLGLRISMDDFGTGYSSLSYLRSFPFDSIKIDRSFIKDLADKPDGDAIIRAIAGLGTSLGMTTVAEGGETMDQMRRIRAEGCTDVQGYLISKPVPSGEIAKLLAHHRHAA